MATQVLHWHPARGHDEIDSIQWQGHGWDGPFPIHTAGADAFANTRATSLSAHGPPSPSTTVPPAFVCSDNRPKSLPEIWNSSHGIVFTAGYASLSMSQMIANAKAAKAKQEVRSVVKMAAVPRDNTPVPAERKAMEKSQVIVGRANQTVVRPKQTVASELSTPAMSAPLRSEKVATSGKQSSWKSQVEETASGDMFAGIMYTLSSSLQGFLEQIEAKREPATSKSSNTSTTAKKGGIFDLRIRETKPSVRDSELIKATSNNTLDWREKLAAKKHMVLPKEPEDKTAKLAQQELSKAETQQALQASLKRRAAKQKRRIEVRRNAELREMRKIHERIDHEKAMRAPRQLQPSPQQADITREIQKAEEYRGQYEQGVRAEARDSYESYKDLFYEYKLKRSEVLRLIAGLSRYHLYRQKDCSQFIGRALPSKLTLGGRPEISPDKMMKYHADMAIYWRGCADVTAYRNKIFWTYAHESRKLTRFHRYKAAVLSPARRQAHALWIVLDSRISNLWETLKDIASDILDLVARRCPDVHKYQLVRSLEISHLRAITEMVDSKGLKQVIVQFTSIYTAHFHGAMSFADFARNVPMSLFLASNCYAELASERILLPFKLYKYNVSKSHYDLKSFLRDDIAKIGTDRFRRYNSFLTELYNTKNRHPFHEIGEFESMLHMREQDPEVIKEMEAYAPVLRKNARSVLRSSRQNRRVEVLSQFVEQKRRPAKSTATRVAAKTARQAKAQASSPVLRKSQQMKELESIRCHKCGQYGHIRADCSKVRSVARKQQKGQLHEKDNSPTHKSQPSQASSRTSNRQAQVQVMDAWLASSNQNDTPGSSQTSSEWDSLSAEASKTLQPDVVVAQPDSRSQQVPLASYASDPSESVSDHGSTWQSLLPNKGAYAVKMPRILQRLDPDTIVALPDSSGGWGTLASQQGFESGNRGQSEAESEREKHGEMEAQQGPENEEAVKTKRKKRRSSSNLRTRRIRTKAIKEAKREAAKQLAHEQEEQMEPNSAEIRDQNAIAYYAQHFKNDAAPESKSLPPSRSLKEGLGVTEAPDATPKIRTVNTDLGDEARDVASYQQDKYRMPRSPGDETPEWAAWAAHVARKQQKKDSVLRSPGSISVATDVPAGNPTIGTIEPRLGTQLSAAAGQRDPKRPTATSLAAGVPTNDLSIDAYFKDFKAKIGLDQKKATDDENPVDHQKLEAERDRRKRDADDMEREVKRLRQEIAIEKQIQDERERFERFSEEAKELAELKKALASVRSERGAAITSENTAPNTDSKRMTGSLSNSVDSQLPYSTTANTTPKPFDTIPFRIRRSRSVQAFPSQKRSYSHRASPIVQIKGAHTWAEVKSDDVNANGGLKFSPTHSMRTPHPGNDLNTPRSPKHMKDSANLVDERDSRETPQSSPNMSNLVDPESPTVSRLVNEKVTVKQTPPTSPVQELGSSGGSWDTIKPSSTPVNQDNLDRYQTLEPPALESGAQDPLGSAMSWGFIHQDKLTGYQEQGSTFWGSAEQDASAYPAPWGSMNETWQSMQEAPVAGPLEEGTQESQNSPLSSAQGRDHDRNEGEVTQGRENDGSDHEINQGQESAGNDNDPNSLSSSSQGDDEGNMGDNEPPSDDEASSDDNASDSDSEDVEKHIPLTYQIPRETLRAAMNTSKSNVDGSSWSYTMYRGPNDEKIDLHYCRNMEVAETVAQYFVDEQVLGFDIEWKPNASAAAGIKGNASLIQLASENRIALFHISLFKGTTADELLPPTIKTILENPAILKTGVAVKSDFTRLRKFLGVEARGVFELSHLYKLVKFSKDEPEKVNRMLVSLANQVAEHLQLPLNKGAVRESDWSKPLLIDQMRYAASDAYAGVRLFDVLEAKRKKLRPTPPRPQCAELGLPIALAEGVVVRKYKSRKVAVVLDEEEEEESDDYQSALEEQEAIEESDEETSSSLDLPEDELSDEVSEEELVAPPTKRVGRVRLQGLSAVSVEPALPPEQTPWEEEESMDEDFDTSSEFSGEGVAAVTKQIGRVNLSTSQDPPASSPTSALELANFWLDAWHAAMPMHRQPIATSGQMRAYALWHEQNLSLAEVAAVLRDPPLATSTVSNYILSAVMLEQLPFKEERIKVLLKTMPSKVVTQRYWRILRTLGVEDVGDLETG